jgi:hypothetical protein
VGFDFDSLGNYGNSYAPAGQEAFLEPGFTEPPGVPGASRRAALALRERLWMVSSIPDVRKCGKVPRDRVMPLLAAPGGGFRLSGLCTCHSVWVCPICAPEIRGARGAEIASAVAGWLTGGGSVTFGTGTLSHSGEHSLRSTYGLVVKAWAAVTQDKSVRNFRRCHGYEGFVRTTEVTYGRNGWHPHMHWLDFWRGTLGWDELKAYEAVVRLAWTRAVLRLGVFRRVSEDHGLVVLPVRTEVEADQKSKYLFEMSVDSASFELTSISTKTARQGGLAPFELLAKVYGPGSKPWVDLWWEYEQATRGRRMLGTSRGLLDRLGLRDEDPEPGELGDVVAWVKADDWGQIRWFTANGLTGVQAVLEAAAAGGQVAVDAAVRLLLGLPVDPVLSPVEWVQPELGPGDDGGMF